MAKMTNTYTEGMDQDSSVNKRNPNTYFSAYNIRVLLNEQLSSGAVTNIQGTTNLDLKTWLDSACTAKGVVSSKLTFTIIGAGDIRDTLILFVVGTNTFGTSYSFIFGLELNKEAITASTLYYTDMFTTDSSRLNFSTSYPIKGFASVYESPQIIKIYWTDYKAETTDFHPLRMMNIAQSDLMTGTVGVSAYSFNLLPEFIPTTPIISSVTSGGDLVTGLVQYAYQLYNKYGTKSSLSPLSNLVHITSSSDSSTRSENYIGDIAGTKTGKSVNVAITVSDTSYNRIKVYAIHYTSDIQVPTIRLVVDTESSALVSVKDDGVNYSSIITLEEFVTLSDNFTAKDLLVKDNILLATNIKTYNFDFNYDARAYRFPLSGTTTKIYHSDGTFDSIGATPSGVKHYTWNAINTIPETHDAINTVNAYTTTTPSAEDTFLYARASTRLGGSGLNVSYDFELHTKVINEATHPEQIYTNINNGHYKDYADYAKVSFRDWQRDEVYRFGIVGFNSKMQPSPVKWIGDIRMPAHNSDDTYTTLTENDCRYNGYGAIISTTANPTTAFAEIKHSLLSIKFTVTNLPTEVKYYQIVYVKREDYDKTILAEGLIGHVYLHDEYYRIPNTGFRASDMSIIYSDQKDNTFQFVSPDVVFEEDLTFNVDDYLRIDTKVYSPGSNYTKFDTREGGGSSLAADKDVKMHETYGHYSTLTNSIFYKLGGLFYANPIANTTNGTTSIDIDALYRYLNWSQGTDLGSGNEHYGSAGSKALLLGKDNVSLDLLSHEGTYYVQYKRPRVNQYGGNTYTARKRNVYIGCSAIVSRSASTVYSYGDMYVSMMDYLYSMMYSDGTIGERIFHASYFPVVSKYNCQLRTAKSAHQLLGEANSVLLQEEVGTYTMTVGSSSSSVTYTYNQDTRLYDYNLVYTRLSDILTYFPKPDNFETISVEDTLTKYSDTKIPKDYIDSWSIFRTLNSGVVDSRFGAIHKLELYNNQVVFFQDKAIGIWYVNMRELASTNNPGALSLGIGGVLEQFLYITKESGTKYPYSVVNTGAGLYYFDSYSKHIHRVSGNEQLQITKVLGLSKLLRELSFSPVDNPLTNEGTGILAAYNKEYNEVLFTITGSNSINRVNTFTILYSELGNKFYGFMDIEPRIYKQFNGVLLSTNNLTKLYSHDSGNYNTFYDVLCDSRITLLISPRVQEGIKQYVFSEHNFLSDCSLNGVDVDKTISTVECSNTYQVASTLDFDDNPEVLVRRNRLYRFYIPREDNAEESRLADTYLKTTITFKNDSNYKFTLYDMDTIFLPTTL